jgi:hypothetical protein
MKKFLVHLSVMCLLAALMVPMVGCKKEEPAVDETMSSDMAPAPEATTTEPMSTEMSTDMGTMSTDTMSTDMAPVTTDAAPAQ